MSRGADKMGLKEVPEKTASTEFHILPGDVIHEDFRCLKGTVHPKMKLLHHSKTELQHSPKQLK